MDDFLRTCHQYVFVVITTLFFFQSLVLFVRAKNNAARKTMAYMELLWGLVYLISLVSMITINPVNRFSLFRPMVLVSGNYFISFMLFFPMQVFLPGWLNLRRVLLFISPILVISIIYYGVMFLLGERPLDILSFQMLIESIGAFNVWFRFVILASCIAYIVLILKWLGKYERKYNQWKNENYADQERVDISWMRPYNYIILLITGFYMAGLMLGGRLTMICHGLCVSACFSYLFYKALFFENSYPENFFAEPKGRALKMGILEIQPLEEMNTTVEEEENDQSFKKRIPGYVETIKQWMDEEKPYLYTDFKLMDVVRVIPLNRSYLSRIFNEGFGKSFSEVVRAYRVEYSKELLKANPSMPMYEVAAMCGFSSDSTYTRAFKLLTGVTPTRYRSS